MISIRREKTIDPAAIRRVLDGAFGRQNESNVVDAVRRRAAVVFSLVAMRAETVVGYVMFTEARLDTMASPAWLDEMPPPTPGPMRALVPPAARPQGKRALGEPEPQWLSLEEEFEREQREREMAEVAEKAKAAAHEAEVARRAAARRSFLESTTQLRAINAGLTAAPPWVRLGPIGVLPNQQHKGIGTLLVETGLEHLAKTPCQGVFVVGYSGYFEPMGFVSTKPFGIAWQVPVLGDKLQVREVKPQALAGKKGVVSFEPELQETS